MSRINLGRVVIGGLLAGLIINVGEFILNGVLLEEEMNAAMAALNRPPVDPSMIIWFVLFSFGFAVILVWTYAAIRPRFGPGIKTAMCASTLCWGLGVLYPNLFFYVMNHVSEKHNHPDVCLGAGRGRHRWNCGRLGLQGSPGPGVGSMDSR